MNRQVGFSLNGHKSHTITQRLADQLKGAVVPKELQHATKLRVLDVLGLALAGRTFEIGASVIAAATRTEEAGKASIIGGPGKLPAATAAMVNGVLAEAIEFDDSHNETVVHASTPVVAAALATAQTRRVGGAGFIRAVALGNEVTCRIAVGAPGLFHPIGFHPTGIFGAFGAAMSTAILQEADTETIVRALGIAGSFASGLLESWSDGSWGKLINPGWAAQSGLWAARLAESGFTGPKTVLEGKFGLFASHLDLPAEQLSLDRITRDLGRHWESDAISFKPYPNAHVMHGVLDAARYLLANETVDADDIVAVECLVAPYMVGMVCEPQSEKRRPPTSAQARISLHHSLAELFVTGRLDVTSYSDQMLRDARVQHLADRVRYTVVPDWTTRIVYPGGVRIHLADGRIMERIETANLGSKAKPMSGDNVREKFLTNAQLVLPGDRAEDIANKVFELDRADNVGELLGLCAIG